MAERANNGVRDLWIERERTQRHESTMQSYTLRRTR